MFPTNQGVITHARICCCILQLSPRKCLNPARDFVIGLPLTRGPLFCESTLLEHLLTRSFCAWDQLTWEPLSRGSWDFRRISSFLKFCLSEVTFSAMTDVRMNRWNSQSFDEWRNAIKWKKLITKQTPIFSWLQFARTHRHTDTPSHTKRKEKG